MGERDERAEPPGYADFVIGIGAGDGSSYPVTVRSPAGETTGPVALRFPFDEQTLDNHLLALEVALLRSGGSRRRIVLSEQKRVQEFGSALFESLFADDVRILYERSRDDVLHGGRGLRIRLRIEAPELAALPWEFLYDARQAEYLCLSTTTPLVRDVGLMQPIRPLGITPPLRILGLIASPSDLAALDVERERGRVEAALRPLRERGLVALHWLEGQTFRDLQQEIRQGVWHVFHFIGHGAFDSVADEGLIALADEHGQTHRLPATGLARLLADEPALRLVVLNSCDGARGGERDIFSSTASIIVRRGIPAVLAMQYEITDQAAIEFARGFYEALVDGVPVDVAVAEARKSVSLAVRGTLEWATPVLYLRATDGVLFDIKAPARDVTAPVAAPANRVADRSPAPVVDQSTDDRGGPRAGQTVDRSPWEALPRRVWMASAGVIVVLLVLMGWRLLSADEPPITPTPGVTPPLSQDVVAITGLTIEERNVPFGEFCERPGRMCAVTILSSSRERLEWPGHVMSFRVEADGFAGMPLKLRWTMIDDRTGRPVDHPDLEDQDVGTYRPPAAADPGVTADFWVPLHGTAGTYRVRLALLSDTEERLAVAESVPFVVRDS